MVQIAPYKYALYYCGHGIEYRTTTDGISFSERKQALPPERDKIICNQMFFKFMDNGGCTITKKEYTKQGIRKTM